MASLDIPFLVFSKSNFVFETNPSCFSDVLIQEPIEQDPGYDGKSEGPILALSDTRGEVIFYSLDVDSRTIVKKGQNKKTKTHKSYYHLLLHPKLLLLPSISLKEKVGKLLDGVIVESPAKFILSTSDYLWVSLHDDNVIRIWSISDGRCLMFSPKELFLTKLKRIFPIPTYDGYLL